MNLLNDKITPILRTKEESRAFYDAFGPVYSFFASPFEKRFTFLGLKLLNISPREDILDVGFGTGEALKYIAERVGKKGSVYGIDISSTMVNITKKKLKNADLADRVHLRRKDATTLPYSSNRFDAVFMSFTLELFRKEDIFQVLKEIKRVLNPKGRLGVVSLSKENEKSLSVKLYEFFHIHFPKFFDCRPIFLEELLKVAGFKIKMKRKTVMYGLPIEIVIATK